jgi:D-alanine-D-alanine ligase
LKKIAKKTLKTKKKTNGSIPILGPVEDLENYVQSDWWNHIFNSLYLKTDSDVVDDNDITRKEIDMFSNIVDLKKEDDVLDLCCGQGRHVLELSRRGFKVEGLDRSRFLVQKAKATAKKENISVRFREGDARKLPFPPDTFEVVMMLGNSFGYFETVQDDLRILKEIFKVLKPWGRLLLDVTDGEYLKKNFQNRSWEWIDKKLFVCRERTLSVDEERLI